MIYAIWADFFGEFALNSAQRICTSNVVAVEPVLCMALNRVDYQLIFKNLQPIMLELHSNLTNTGLASSNDNVAIIHKASVCVGRRVTAVNSCSVRSDGYVDTILKRMAKYMTECYWNSMYHRYFRDLLLRPHATEEYGDYACLAMADNPDRRQGIKNITMYTQMVLQTEPESRSAPELQFLLGLLNKKHNKFINEYCNNWTAVQLSDLCKRVTYLKVKATGTVRIVFIIFVSFDVLFI